MSVGNSETGYQNLSLEELQYAQAKETNTEKLSQALGTSWAAMKNESSPQYGPQKKIVILLLSGALSPVHKGHTEMLLQAGLSLERAKGQDYIFAAGALSPSSHSYVFGKLGAAAIKEPMRNILTSQAAANFPHIVNAPYGLASGGACCAQLQYALEEYNGIERKRVGCSGAGTVFRKKVRAPPSHTESKNTTSPNFDPSSLRVAKHPTNTTMLLRHQPTSDRKFTHFDVHNQKVCLLSTEPTVDAEGTQWFLVHSTSRPREESGWIRGNYLTTAYLPRTTTTPSTPPQFQEQKSSSSSSSSAEKEKENRNRYQLPDDFPWDQLRILTVYGSDFYCKYPHVSSSARVIMCREDDEGSARRAKDLNESQLKHQRGGKSEVHPDFLLLEPLQPIPDFSSTQVRRAFDVLRSGAHTEGGTEELHRQQAEEYLQQALDPAVLSTLRSKPGDEIYCTKVGRM